MGREQISGQRLVVMVDGWDVGHVFPFGHYVMSLGPVGEVGGWVGGHVRRGKIQAATETDRQIFYLVYYTSVSRSSSF